MSERLEADGLATLVLDESAGYIVAGLDLGFPAARGVTAERSNADGVIDSTAFYGSRAVSLDLAVFATPGTTRRQALDRLRAFASPRRRPVLYFDEGTGADRRIQLRGDQLGWPLDHPEVSVVQVAFVAPEGIVEAATATTVEAGASPAPEPGRTYPRDYTLAYPRASALGTVTATNDGTEPAAPVMQLWGPCTGPRLTNLTTGETLSLPRMALTAEQYAEVDVREATVRMQGRASSHLYSQLDLTESSFWWLDPGGNVIRYGPDEYGPGAHAVITYRSAWI